ncbi:hypothetical protein Goari_018069 [Gossypium aridum]|uniref:Uncharacterized protein n=1 Tax=Gossypium aridum TaxID=34290 RepID=A0A7J8WPT0_GOSAI|nr:hypothetical protein [Gossypium aridum]
MNSQQKIDTMVKENMLKFMDSLRKQRTMSLN